MTQSIDFNLMEWVLYWGTAAVATLATLYTLVTSADLEARKAAIFNLFSFMFVTVTLYYVLEKFLPSYGFANKARQDWLPFSGWTILIYMIYADFLFYLYHKLTHSVPLFWVGHFSHHSGSRLHLSLIVRDNLLAHIFLLPIGLLGIPLGLSPVGIYICIKFIIFYQSFLHYETRKDIPILRYVFVTPYNHILHHSIRFENAGHNFGGILCIWDRVCGTYRDDRGYLNGVGVPDVKHPNSLWTLNVFPLMNLLQLCWRERSILPLFFFKNLSYRPVGIGGFFYLLAGGLTIEVIRSLI